MDSTDVTESESKHSELYAGLHSGSTEQNGNDRKKDSAEPKTDNKNKVPALQDGEAVSPAEIDKPSESDTIVETVNLSVQMKMKRHRDGTVKVELSENTPKEQGEASGHDCGAMLRGQCALQLKEDITAHLSKRICEGAKVFQGVHHGRQGEAVAVKFITKYTEENITELQSEVKNLKEASEHENVVTYYSSGFCKYKGKDAIYIAMELCDEQTVQKRIKSKMLKRDFPEKIDEAHQISRGLHHIHKCRILHRDLKPHNILYKNGKCKISDFGFSKRLPPGKSNTPQSMANVGTDGWRAPETSESETHSSPSSDVYSLALIIYYILTDGEHPFGKHEASRQCYIRDNRKVDLQLCERMPDSKIVEDLLRIMLSWCPKDRPSMEVVLKHPLFWDIKAKLGLFENIAKYEEFREADKKENRPASDFPHLAVILDDRIGKYGDLVLRGDWKKALILTPEEQNNFNRDGQKAVADCIAQKATRGFHGSSVFSLIKFIRNRNMHHYQDRATQNLQMSDKERWDFYSGRFPYVFIYAYYKVKQCLSRESVDSHFKELFKMFYSPKE